MRNIILAWPFRFALRIVYPGVMSAVLREVHQGCARHASRRVSNGGTWKSSAVIYEEIE